MIAASRTSASTRTASLLLWLACGLTGVVACSNQITYSRIDVTKPGANAPPARWDRC
jgi:hypothetical protein